MSRSKKILFAMTALIMIIACNMPGVQPAAATPDYVATITAQAQLLQPSLAPQVDIVNTSTPELPVIIFTDTPTPTITFTATPGIPMVSVSADTNCRRGPGKEYDNVGALLINQSAEIVGKSTPTGYWIIKNPERDGTCWLWGTYAIVTGDISSLPEIPIPPTPTPSIPEAPKGLTASKICFFNGVTYDLGGSIAWNDGPNESGYNVYFLGAVFATLPANTTTTALPHVLIVPGGSIKLSVEAFNSAGKSAKKSIEIFCP